MKRRLRLALPLAFVLFLADCTTKEWASEVLEPAYIAHPVIGDFVRFTLAYNNGAAMGLPLGPYARWPLVAFSIAAVGALIYYAVTAPSGPRSRQLGLGLLIGGALGNLVSRIFSQRGVVDFIDIGVGTHRFYVFNVADIGITIGAVMLAVMIYRAPSSHETESPTAIGPPSTT